MGARCALAPGAPYRDAPRFLPAPPRFRSRRGPAAHEARSGARGPISAQNNKAWCWSTWAPARPERGSFAWRERDWPPRCLETRAVNQRDEGRGLAASVGESQQRGDEQGCSIITVIQRFYQLNTNEQLFYTIRQEFLNTRLRR